MQSGSTLSIIYNDLKNLIETRATEIKHVDKFNSQIRNVTADSNLELPFLTPACFIHFENIDYVDLGQKMQEGTGEIVFTICDFNLVENETDIFEVKHQVNKAIMYHKDLNDYYTILSRVGETMNTLHGNVNEFEIRYRFKFIESFEDSKFHLVGGLSIIV